VIARAISAATGAPPVRHRRSEEGSYPRIVGEFTIATSIVEMGC